MKVEHPDASPGRCNPSRQPYQAMRRQGIGEHPATKAPQVDEHPTACQASSVSIQLHHHRYATQLRMDR